jgi:hypothetical protein
MSTTDAPENNDNSQPLGLGLSEGLGAGDGARRTTGYYFKFDRGQWVKEGDKPATFFQGSGRAYVGCLTLEQRNELDALIDGYLKSLGA